MVEVTSGRARVSLIGGWGAHEIARNVRIAVGQKTNTSNSDKSSSAKLFERTLESNSQSGGEDR